ncbi:putative SEP domain-containing protein [Rosellinia necatrix]|uniref:Putative SEP domain-containing protein n=1 Tax=Rosellinia necatrix TaxID=77044 RepID=A0A1W2TR18_ROSNE|nr:putative SEP domain-containing protein [Rosellinia necatrix]
MDSNVDHDALTSQFVNATGASVQRATEYLTASNWDLAAAAQSYFADEDEDETAADTAGSSAAPPGYTGPRTLDGRPAPQAIPTTSSSSASKRPQKKKGLATLSSLGGGNAHDDDDDDDEDDDEDAALRDTYAGGEKSGLAVQDPNQRADPRRIINDLISKAKSNARRPEASAPAGPSSSSSFRGSGQTLGGEGTESRVIPDPLGAPSRAQGAEPQSRTLHLWRDGFSIDDGELRRFDDPANAEDLRMIQSGRAPVHLMNVRYDEPIDVKLEQHNENYRPLPKVYRPFGSEGRRLGSPVPGEAVAATSTTVPTTAASSSPSSSAAATSNTPIDNSQPTVMIRIQMPDGTRLPARFNTSQTVSDIYDFISRASPELRSSGWVLATTFPNKDHTDKSLVIGDMGEFKKGGTAVVKKTG